MTRKGYDSNIDDVQASESSPTHLPQTENPTCPTSETQGTNPKQVSQASSPTAVLRERFVIRSASSTMTKRTRVQSGVRREGGSSLVRWRRRGRRGNKRRASQKMAKDTMVEMKHLEPTTAVQQFGDHTHSMDTSNTGDQNTTADHPRTKLDQSCSLEQRKDSGSGQNQSTPAGETTTTPSFASPQTTTRTSESVRDERAALRERRRLTLQRRYSVSLQYGKQGTSIMSTTTTSSHTSSSMQMDTQPRTDQETSRSTKKTTSHTYMEIRQIRSPHRRGRNLVSQWRRAQQRAFAFGMSLFDPCLKEQRLKLLRQRDEWRPGRAASGTMDKGTLTMSQTESPPAVSNKPSPRFPMQPHPSVSHSPRSLVPKANLGHQQSVSVEAHLPSVEPPSLPSKTPKTQSIFGVYRRPLSSCPNSAMSRRKKQESVCVQQTPIGGSTFQRGCQISIGRRPEGSLTSMPFVCQASLAGGDRQADISLAGKSTDVNTSAISKARAVLNASERRQFPHSSGMKTSPVVKVPTASLGSPPVGRSRNTKAPGRETGHHCGEIVQSDNGSLSTASLSRPNKGFRTEARLKHTGKDGQLSLPAQHSFGIVPHPPTSAARSPDEIPTFASHPRHPARFPVTGRNQIRLCSHDTGIKEKAATKLGDSGLCHQPEQSCAISKSPSLPQDHSGMSDSQIPKRVVRRRGTIPVVPGTARVPKPPSVPFK